MSPSPDEYRRFRAIGMRPSASPRDSQSRLPAARPSLGSRLSPPPWSATPAADAPGTAASSSAPPKNKASAPAAGALSSSKWVLFALLFSAYASYKLRELRKSPFRTLFSGYLSFLRLCLLALGATSLLSSTLLAGDLQSVARTLFQRWKTIVILFAVPPYATFKTLYEVGILGRRTSKRWTIRMEWFVRLLRSPPWAVTYMCNGDGTAYLTEVVSAFGKCGTLLDGYNLWLCRANFPQLRIQRQLVGVQSEPCPMTWYEFPGECVPGTERSWWVKLFGGLERAGGGPRDPESTVRGEKTVKMGDPGT